MAFFVDAPFDVEFLRTASFGLLQGSRMRNVKTEFVLVSFLWEDVI